MALDLVKRAASFTKATMKGYQLRRASASDVVAKPESLSVFITRFHCHWEGEMACGIAKNVMPETYNPHTHIHTHTHREREREREIHQTIQITTIIF